MLRFHVQVRDTDVQHVAKLGAACDNLNSSAPNSLRLNLSDSLVAPVVILAHSRAHYLAKTFLTLHRWVLLVWREWLWVNV